VQKKERVLRVSKLMWTRHLLKAFQNSFRGILFLCAVACVFMPLHSFAKTSVLKSKRKFAPAQAVLEKPCDGAFEMKVTVSAVDSLVDDVPVGLSLKIENKTFRGIASHIHNEESGAFNKEKCLFWQKKIWPLVTQMKHENARPGREKMVCRNLASLEYSLNGKSTTDQYCLGDARSDGLTFLFRHFYDGTEYLMGM
jgi:hypothetical protein